MPVRQKQKRTQNKTPNAPHGRDLFQTPNYATELLVPFIPKEIKMIWECAAGEGKIVNILRSHNYKVILTDLSYEKFGKFNFLKDELDSNSFDCIITNPPFSLKKEFYEKCMEYGKPFALLIPTDYCGWLIDAIQNKQCEKIIPTRRVDYITPSGLSGANGHTSNFHSMWLTYGFELGKTEVFVELTKEMKNNI